MRANRGTLTEPGTQLARTATARPTRTWSSSARCATASSPTARTCCARRSTWPRPTSTCATRRSTASSTPTHHRTGDKWCIYPMYTYAHPIEDALENITHSLCTLEFEDQRPFYDWLLERLAEGGLLAAPLPQQIEFARLNLTYVRAVSKRKLIQLVDEGHVEGWDDPRMPTLVGARRRGYTPEGFRLFAERIGVSKANSAGSTSAMLEDCDARGPERGRAAAHGGARSGQARDRQLSRGPGRGVRRAQPSAEARLGQARGAVLARAVDRARRLRRDARPRATSASFPATRCACATATS